MALSSSWTSRSVAPLSAAGSGAGRYGISVGMSGGSGMGDAVNSVWDWLNRPFAAPMSPSGIFLLVGSVLVAILLWNVILYHVRIAAETL